MFSLNTVGLPELSTTPDEAAVTTIVLRCRVMLVAETVIAPENVLSSTIWSATPGWPPLVSA